VPIDGPEPAAMADAPWRVSARQLPGLPVLSCLSDSRRPRGCRRGRPRSPEAGVLEGPIIGTMTPNHCVLRTAFEPMVPGLT